VQENEDQKQFFRDLGTSVEEAIGEVRGFEENYQAWMAGISEKLHGYAAQDFAAAFVFARNLSQVSDFNEFTRIQIAYIENSSQLFFNHAQDLAMTYAKLVLGAVTPPAFHLPG